MVTRRIQPQGVQPVLVTQHQFVLMESHQLIVSKILVLHGRACVQEQPDVFPTIVEHVQLNFMMPTTKPSTVHHHHHFHLVVR